jgi:hypothetical protein
MSRSRRRSGPLASALLSGLLVGACSAQYCGEGAFQRGSDLRTGEIHGTLLLPDGTRKAAFAHAAIRGTALVRRTTSEGSFVLCGLPASPGLLPASGG